LGWALGKGRTAFGKILRLRAQRTVDPYQRSQGDGGIFRLRLADQTLNQARRQLVP
jgi:hypothetical protein